MCSCHVVPFPALSGFHHAQGVLYGQWCIHCARALSGFHHARLHCATRCYEGAVIFEEAFVLGGSIDLRNPRPEDEPVQQLPLVPAKLMLGLRESALPVETAFHFYRAFNGRRAYATRRSNSNSE